ncbi:hypothetical protein AB0N60_26820 [Streptomyces microflavus]|uniref:hypothetical protein n=1 Tax=Streptomyces microflavus TaxID=1919 RepID=UPI0034390D25
MDTNALLSSVENDCRKGFRSRLLRMSDDGTVALYAADHVLDETYEHLPRMAKRGLVPLETLRSHFEAEYLPALRFVMMSESDDLDEQVLAIADPDDVPTGRLAKLVAPCVVLSDDKHLKRPGFAPKNWHKAATSAVSIGEGRQRQTITANAAALPLRGVAGLVASAGRSLGVSPWLLGAAVLGAGALLFKDADRRKVTTTFVGAVVQVLGEQLTLAAAQERRGIEGLRAAMLPAVPTPTVRQQIAVVLARQTKPLLATEVHGLIYDYFPDEVAVGVQDVRTLLEEGSEFVRVQRYRWQLGREVTPRLP